MACSCNKTAPDRLEFIKCAPGRDSFSFTPLYAFDDIQDLAAWLVEQFAEKSA
jgi:hypothetical protein